MKDFFLTILVAICGGFLLAQINAPLPWTLGPVLAVSEAMPLDLEGATLEELAALRAARVPGQRVNDKLRQLAVKNVDRLKIAGDHVVLPRAAGDFAAGRFFAAGRTVGFLAEDGTVRRTSTVEYRADGSRVFLESTR